MKMLVDSSTTVGGGTFQTIITAMEDVGYSVEWQVLNSRYFGIAQNRERVFLIGHLGRERIEPVFPVAEDSRKIIEPKGYEDIVSNTIASGDRRSVGIYPIIGGVAQSKRLPQVAYLNYRKIEEVGVTVAKTLCARDYKGFGTGWDTMNAVIYEDDKS